MEALATCLCRRRVTPLPSATAQMAGRAKGSLPAQSRLSFPGASRGRSRPIVARHISARRPQ